jgi:hypothetical protein
VTWKIALVVMLAPPVLSLLLAVVVRIIWPFAISWRASLASKWGDRTFADFMHRALTPALLELQGGIYGWYWILGRIAALIAFIGIFAGFFSVATFTWLLVISAVSKALLRSHLLESRRIPTSKRSV